MSRRAHSQFTSPRAPSAHQPVFPYAQGASIATDSAFPAPNIFSTDMQHPCPPVSLDMHQYQLQDDFDLSFNHLQLSGPDATSLLSFQPPFSYVTPPSHDPDISGLSAASLQPDNQFPFGSEFPVFAELQDVDANSGSCSPENRNPKTPSPSFGSRHGNRRSAAQRRSTPASSPACTPSPYLTSPTGSMTLSSPRTSIYAPIAPRSDEPQDANDRAALASSKKRRKHPAAAPSPRSSSSPSSSSSSADGAAAADPQQRLSAADALLVRLREDEGMAWKDVAARFREETGQDFSVAALQMRLKRFRERVRPWTERDVLALRMAHDYWISHKFEIIAAKMTDFGIEEPWTGRQCARKLQQMGFPTSPIEEKN